MNNERRKGLAKLNKILDTYPSDADTKEYIKELELILLDEELALSAISDKFMGTERYEKSSFACECMNEALDFLNNVIGITDYDEREDHFLDAIICLEDAIDC